MHVSALHTPDNLIAVLIVYLYIKSKITIYSKTCLIKLLSFLEE